MLQLLSRPLPIDGWRVPLDEGGAPIGLRLRWEARLTAPQLRQHEGVTATSVLDVVELQSPLCTSSSSSPLASPSALRTSGSPVGQDAERADQQEQQPAAAAAANHQVWKKLPGRFLFSFQEPEQSKAPVLTSSLPLRVEVRKMSTDLDRRRRCKNLLVPIFLRLWWLQPKE